MIAILMPAFCWISVTLLFIRRGWCWRSSFLMSSVVWGSFVAVSTEVLSLFAVLTPLGLSISWGTAATIAIMLYYSSADRSQNMDLQCSPFFRNLLGGVSAVLLTTCFIAFVAPPNNWDSMTYHMSRVVHWIQNKSVAHYPTHILRQIEMNPWAEFAIMHLQILSGSDRFANLIQWFSMFGSIIGITLLAKQLGADVRGQIFAAVVAATIPMGILQSTSTQNDYVVTFWLVCFVQFGMTAKERPTGIHLVAAGASLGLATLTKGTAYLYAFPFALWFLYAAATTYRWKMVVPLLVMFVVACSLNIGHYSRNYVLFGNPLSSGDIRYVNEKFSCSLVVSNIIKNVSLHAGTPSTKINKVSASVIGAMHSMLRVDINDHATTYLDATFDVIRQNAHEDTAGNPLHLLLILSSACLSLFYRKELQGAATGLLPYVAAVATAFLLFCVVLKWQPWASRLHLPLFVLWSPAIAITFGGIQYERLANAVTIVILLAAIPYVLRNDSRPLISKGHRPSIVRSDRLDQYFYNRPELKGSYTSSTVLAHMQGCDRIGLVMGGDDWEYPIWVIARTMWGVMPRIEHVQVTNASKRRVPGDFEPCFILQNDSEGYLVPHPRPVTK